jgi:pantoate--beta-alanine ligase
MQLITSAAEMRRLASELGHGGRVLGLVPTMGLLHGGHLSLVRRARAESDRLIVTIFVNPLQFGPSEDYPSYPRNLDHDLEMLRPFDVEAVFAPNSQEMYPPGFATRIEPGPAAAPLEGSARPGHFRGVATVVLKLLNLVEPDVAYFGQKDFQQAVVIRRMVADLNVRVRIVVCPIVREFDGLALSSRNTYLNLHQRRAATVLYRSLRNALALYHSGERDAVMIEQAMSDVVRSEPLATPEYAAAVNPVSMERVRRAEAGSVALVAARVGPARLIDNLILGPENASDEHLIGLAFGAAA